MTTRVHVTITSTFPNPTARIQGRTLACMTAVDTAARYARDDITNAGGQPNTMRLLRRQDLDRDDEATFTYYTDHTFTFTDDPNDDGEPPKPEHRH